MPHSYRLDDQIVLALRRIARATDLRSRGLMQSHGLTGPQLTTLQTIARLQPVTAGAVARQIHLGQPTLTGVLNRLERQGLVQRSRGERDRRAVELRLTAEGERVLQAAPSVLEDKFQRRLAELKPWEQTQILATLQRLAAMMDDDAGNESPFPVDPALALGLHTSGRTAQDGASPWAATVDSGGDEAPCSQREERGGG